MDLNHQLQDRIRPVRTRLRRVAVVRGAVWGLLVGAGIALALAVARWLGLDMPWLVAFWMPWVSSAVAAMIYATHVPSWQDVAGRIDCCYGLKDRTATALEFAGRNELSVLERLQINDAISQLRSISATQVSPTILPRLLPYACVLLLGGWALLCMPVEDKHALADPPSVSPHLLQLADDLEETLIEPLKDLNDSQRDELNQEDQQNVDDLLKDLNQMVRQMKLPGVQTRDALVQLSEMQQQLKEVQASLDQTLVDAKMHDLGKIMELDESARDLSQALQKADYETAANELDAFQPDPLSADDKRRMAKDMKELSAEMRQQRLNDLAQATDELGESLSDPSKPPDQSQKSAASKLADLARQFAARQAIARNLAAQRARLNESKGIARSGGDNKRRSNQPRRTWGYGKAEESLTGDATSTDTQRRREQVTGVAGEGPSEREVIKSNEATESVELDYSQRYEQYRRTAESVLQQEELPLGHRETIRRYFESIAVESEQ